MTKRGAVVMRVTNLLKWLGIILGSLIGIASIGVAVIYVWIGSDLSRTFDVAASRIAVSQDEANVAEGERLARLRGCSGGCHGKDSVTGSVFFEVPDGTKLIAPDLARIARQYSDADLELAIRHGVKPDGTSVVLPMPSSMFYDLSDRDLGSIIAYLRAQDPGPEPLPESYFGPLARIMLLVFKQETNTILAAEEIDHERARLNPGTANPLDRGRYLASTMCTECHGAKLRGTSDGTTPSLAVVAAYSIKDFSTLMRSGVPAGGRELELMADVARSRFTHLTDLEISDLHAYLATLISQ